MKLFLSHIAILAIQFYCGHAWTKATQTPIIIEGRHNFVMVPTGDTYGGVGRWQAVDRNGGAFLTNGYIRLVGDLWNIESTWESSGSEAEIYSFFGRPNTSHTMPNNRMSSENAWVSSATPTERTEVMMTNWSKGKTRTACYPAPGSFADSAERVEVEGGPVRTLIHCAENALQQFANREVIGVERGPILNKGGTAACYAYFGKASDLIPTVEDYAWRKNFACVFKLFLLPGKAVGNLETFKTVSMGTKATAQECGDSAEHLYYDCNGMTWNSSTLECLAVWSMEGVEPLHRGTSPWNSAFFWRTRSPPPTPELGGNSTTTKPATPEDGGSSTTTKQQQPANVGVIVGSAMGGVVGLAALGGLLFALYRRRRGDEEEEPLEFEGDFL